MDELRVVGMFKDLSALLCLRYAMDRAALGFYTHGAAVWPTDPFFGNVTEFRAHQPHYDGGPALMSVDEFVTDPPAK